MNVLFVLPILKQQLHSQGMDAEEIKQQITMRAASQGGRSTKTWWEKMAYPLAN